MQSQKPIVICFIRMYTYHQGKNVLKEFHYSFNNVPWPGQNKTVLCSCSATVYTLHSPKTLPKQPPPRGDMNPPSAKCSQPPITSPSTTPHCSSRELFPWSPLYQTTGFSPLSTPPYNKAFPQSAAVPLYPKDAAGRPIHL